MRIYPEKLDSQLKNQLLPIYLISGDEELLISEAAKIIQEAALQKDFVDQIKRQSDIDFSWEKISALLQQDSLFGKTLITLRITTQKAITSGQEVITNYAKNPHASKLLVLITPKLDSKNLQKPWVKAVDKAGGVIQIWPINEEQLPNWIMQRFSKSGLKSDYKTAQLLAEYSAGNLLAAAQEIEKLSLLYQGGQVSSKEVLDVISDQAKFDIFDLVDYALAGNSGKAIRILQKLVNEKIESTFILWAFAREIRLLANISHELERGSNFKMVCDKFKIWEKKQPLIRKVLQHQKLQDCYYLLSYCEKIDLIIKGQEVGNVSNELERLILLLTKEVKAL